MRHNTFVSRIHYQSSEFVQHAPESKPERHLKYLFCSEFAHLIHALAGEFDSTNS